MKRDFNRSRMLKWVGLGILSLLVVAAATGFLVQFETDTRSRAEHPYTGDFVDVDGHYLHYRESEEGGFTFVLEPDIGDYSGSWGVIEDALDEMGRVFVYDRAGYGWSQQGPEPRTIQQLTAELRSALENARVRKPYILIGHGLGGAIQTLYAMEYPEDVAAMLLIDPMHKDQFETLPRHLGSRSWLARSLPGTARLGVGRLFFRSADPVKNRTSHLKTMGAELRDLEESVENWDAGAVDLGNIPVYVLTAGAREFTGDSTADESATRETWESLHAELAGASSSPLSRHIVVEDASHYIHRDDPQVVLQAAGELVAHIAGG